MITLYTFGPAFGLPDPSPFVTKGLVLMKMSGLPFEVKTGGLSKAPKGKLPYLDDGGKLIGDTTFMLMHLADKHGVDLDKGLTPEQRGVGWAFEKMCDEHLYWALIDSRWMIDANFNKGPINFFNAVPALVRPLVIAKVRRDMKRSLYGHGMGRHTRDEIITLAKRDLDAISAQLGDKPFLFGTDPHAADAATFAFVNGCATPFFDSPINDYARSVPNLAAYAQRGMARWFPEMAG